MKLISAAIVFMFSILPIAHDAPALADLATDRNVLEQVDRQLSRSAVIRADFVQQRSMRVLKRPLTSSGAITAVAERGVLWQVREPHQVTVLITADSIIEWDGDGERRELAGASSSAFRALADTLLGFLTGDTLALGEFFDSQAIAADQGWGLRLTPKDTTLRAIIDGVEIFGDRFVREILIVEAAGDRTEILFSNYRTEPKILDDSEQRYFDP